jgi:death-on-curing protein
MTAWRWLAPPVVFAIHDRQIAQHGGGQGVRDAGAIESALARPQNLAAYGAPDAAALAAAYAYGLARNHGFVDGNKRVAWIAARLFLADNGYGLRFDRAGVVHLMQALAAGQLSERELAAWFSERMGR